MVTYYAALKTAKGDIVTFYDEDRERVISEMIKYVKINGFTYLWEGGRYTIKDYVLVEKEPVYGSPTLSEISYYKLADHNNRRRPHETLLPHLP